MTRVGWLGTLALAGTIGCAHTKTTDDGTPQETQEKNEKETNEGEAKKAAKKPAATPGTSHGKAADRDGVPIATAPGGLLAEGGEQKIRKRLVAEGCLADDAKGSLSDGLRQCQKAHDLPATGIADHATVKALGLNPDEIFRQGPVKD
jgi:hypothetical protein